jgi:hypothetical protein
LPTIFRLELVDIPFGLRGVAMGGRLTEKRAECSRAKVSRFFWTKSTTCLSCLPMWIEAAMIAAS